VRRHRRSTRCGWSNAELAPVGIRLQIRLAAASEGKGEKIPPSFVNRTAAARRTVKASTIRAWAGALRGFAESRRKILPRVTGARATALALPLLREHPLGGGVRADHYRVLDLLPHEGKEAPDTLLLVDCVPDDEKSTSHRPLRKRWHTPCVAAPKRKEAA
jgi:hypothetical protein